MSFSQVDFQDVEARTLAERKRHEEKQKRLERIYKEKLEKAKQEMEGKLTKNKGGNHFRFLRQHFNNLKHLFPLERFY